MENNHYFIVWNHGFKYIEKILDMIRDHPYIKIQRIFRKTVELGKFIKHIYKLDKASSSHIQAKSKYLQQIKPEIYIIFVRDLKTLYRFKNGHKYSYNETYLKWYIRLLFNPKHKGASINITEKLINDGIISAKNWPSSMTHNHVIHSSDIEEETQLIIDYFKLHNQFFNVTGNNFLNKKKIIKEVNVSDIVCNIVGHNNIEVKDSPHYKYLLGNYKEKYNDYILKNMGTIITCDNLSGAYDKLINNFNYGKMIEDEPSYIVCRYIPKIKKYQVADGLHRLSILLYKNITKFNCYIV